MTASTDFTVGGGVKDAYVSPNSSSIAEVKELIVYTDDTPTAAETLTVTFAKYGITSIWGVDFWYHTTANSVVVPVDMVTTSVTSGVLTLTIPAGPSTQICVFKIYYI